MPSYPFLISLHPGRGPFLHTYSAFTKVAGCNDTVQLAEAEKGYLLQGSWSVAEDSWTEMLQITEGLVPGT